MNSDHLRLLTFGKSFNWEKLSPELTMLTICIMGIRRRFDYIIRMLDCEEDKIIFQVRDARNSIVPGVAEAFIDEVNYLTSGAFDWMIMDEKEKSESIVAILKRKESQSE